MPTYEYACKSCGEHVEVVQSFTDDPLTTCEACGGPLRKVFGSVGVVLKGSGFYRTDNRVGPRKADSTGTEPKTSADSGAKSAKDSKDSKDSGSTTSTKGDSKVASGASSAKKPA